ncbi:putative membrane protein [Chlamydia psittaci VS225]|nr:putative membrane protein [Chlamydia psittaci VS225]
MINLSRLCNCVNLTNNSETSQGVCRSKSLKISLAVLAVAIPIILMVVGGLGLAGSAGLGLLIFGGIVLAVMGLVAATAFIRSKQFIPVSGESGMGLQPCPELTAEGRAALDNAMQKLNQERDTLQPPNWGGLREPVNPDISHLLSLKSRKNNEVLELLHTDENGRVAFPDDAASRDPVLINAVTELMELSFAVSMYSLRDLEAYRERFPEVTSNLEALSRQESAYYKTFYQMSLSYSLLRHLHMYSQNDVSDADIASRRDRFYQEGTPEFQWRSLYNCFCQQARWYIGNEQEAVQREGRLIRHSTPDTSRGSFGHPGTTPT